MFGPLEREILTQALCRTHGLRSGKHDKLPCKLGDPCPNRETCEAMAQRTLAFVRDLRAHPRVMVAPI